MLTIATEAQISKGTKSLNIRVSKNIPEGDYEVLVVLTQKKPRKTKTAPSPAKELWFASYDIPVNTSLIYSRNEIYGEDGR